MKDLLPDSSTFPTAHCDSCGRVVLVYVTLDTDDRERRCCVHCDTEIAGPLRWVKPGELEQEGYYFGAPSAKGSAGGGCAAGGCGKCGTHGH